MSSPARLILLSGTGGSGTTTLCTATARALEEESLRVALIDADDPAGPDTLDAIEGACTALLAWLGAEPLAREAWAGLGPVRHLSTWARIIAAAEGSGSDAVVVDCGDLRQARDLVEAPTIARRLLVAARTPTLAIRRDDPATDAAGSDDVSAFDRVVHLAALAEEAAALLEAPTTSMRIVTTPDEHAVTAAMRGVAVVSLLGVNVDAVIVNRCARGSDGYPEDVLAEERRQVARAEREAGGPAVWRSTAKVRATPKGRSAMGPLGRSRVLRQGDLAPQVQDEAFSLLLPLSGDAIARARVGRAGDHLVVAVGDVHRWLVLPSVLRRCHVLEAVRAHDGLVVSFAPDASLWRARPDGGQVA